LSTGGTGWNIVISRERCVATWHRPQPRVVNVAISAIRPPSSETGHSKAERHRGSALMARTFSNEPHPRFPVARGAARRFPDPGQSGGQQTGWHVHPRAAATARWLARYCLSATGRAIKTSRSWGGTQRQVDQPLRSQRELPAIAIGHAVAATFGLAGRNIDRHSVHVGGQHSGMDAKLLAHELFRCAHGTRIHRRQRRQPLPPRQAQAAVPAGRTCDRLTSRTAAAATQPPARAV
jgi:hypothetical protein